MPEGTAQFTTLPDSKAGPEQHNYKHIIYGQPCIHNPIGLGLKKVGHFRIWNDFVSYRLFLQEYKL